MSTAARPPGRPRSAEADAAIVRATLEALFEEGFRALSVESVRQRAGVGKATIYRRFADKEALVRAAIVALSPTSGELPDTGTVRGDLERMFAIAYPEVLDGRTVMFGPRLLVEAADDPELHRLFREALIDPRRAAVRTVLARGVARGEVREGLDLEIAVDVLAGPVIYRVLIDGGATDGLTERIGAYLDAALHGIAAA